MCRGDEYNGIGPGDRERSFVDALVKGREIYTARQDVSALEGEIDALSDRLEAVDEEISLLEAELIAEGVTPHRRKHLLGEIHEVEAERDLILFDISRAERDRDDAQTYLDEVLQYHRENYSFGQ